MSEIRDVEVSKVLSHALRHEPWLYELELDDEGWVSIDAALAALRAERQEWAGLSRADLERVVANGAKRRHEIVGDRVRALYGHSLPDKLRRERQAPPDLLLHGTAPDVAELVLVQGLKPMSRQYVHLSIEVGMALEVGRRKARQPLLLHVDARRAHADGIAFYAGNDKVWLADVVPAQYLRVAP